MRTDPFGAPSAQLAERRGGKGRLVGVDAARALALAGMMAVHMLPSRGEDGGPTASYLVFGGRSSALFAVLAGVGLALATGRSTPPRGRDRLSMASGTLVRAAVLAMIGFVLGGLGSPVAVILVHYGMLFAVGALFLGFRPGQLVAIAAVWWVAAPAVSHLIRSGISDPPISVPTFESLADPLTLALDVGLTGYYPVFSWVAFLLVGMAAGRMDLGSTKVASTIAVAGVALAIGAWALSSFLLGPLGGVEDLEGPVPIQFFGTTPTSSWWYLAVMAPHSGTPFDLAHSAGTALGVLGIALLLTRSAQPVWRAVAAAGGMTLTLYSLHVVALALEVGPTEPATRYFIHLVTLFALASVWRFAVGRGPLERLTAELAGQARQLAA